MICFEMSPVYDLLCRVVMEKNACDVYNLSKGADTYMKILSRENGKKWFSSVRELC